MKVRNVTETEMAAALAEINQKYAGNVVWKRFEQNGSGYNFTLTVRSSKEAGGRRGHSGKRVAAACWHVHGDFFDALLEMQPKAVIRSGDKKIDRQGGNWQDWNIGSMIQPLYFSEACDCGS